MEITEDTLSTALTAAVGRVYPSADAEDVQKLLDAVTGAYRSGTLDRTLIGTLAWDILGDMNKGVTLILEMSEALPVIPERDYTQTIG